MRSIRAFFGSVGTLVLLGALTPPASANPVVTDTIGVGTGPTGVAFIPDGTRAYVANYDVGTVSVIDTTTNTVLGSPIPVGSGPYGIAVSPDGTRAYVPNPADDAVAVIDTGTNTVVGSPIPVGNFPYGMAVSPDGTRAYTANHKGNSVSVINTATNTVVGSPIPVGKNPYGVAINPAGTRVYTPNTSDNTVSVINTATNTVVGSPIPVGKAPTAVAVTPDGTRAYTTNFTDGTVSVIDTTTDTVVGSPISVGANPYGVAISPDGTTAYTADYSDDTVSVIDTATNTVVGSPIPVGDGVFGIAVIPDGSRVYTADYLGHTVSVIAVQPSPPTSVTATAGDSQLSVAWSAPAFTGGQPITSYTATASPGGKSCTTADTTCAIMGLTNGTPYTVTVTATNTIGTSDPSTPSAAVTPGAPALSASPDPTVFSDQTVGTGSTEKTVTVTNTGTAPLTVSKMALTGTDPGQFTLGANTCTNPLAPTATCTIKVAFAPTAAGAKTAGLTLTSDAPGSPHTVTLSGIAIEPGLTATPNPVAFSERRVGTTSRQKTVTVTNAGTAPLTVSKVTLGGANPGQFSLGANTCTNPLAPSGTCTIKVAFSPTRTGAKTAGLTLASNAAGSPHTVSLKGTARPLTKQTLHPGLPERIKVSGLTVITRAKARTNAGQSVRTIVRGGPANASAAGEVRYFTVVRGPHGKASVRTFGRTDLKLRIVQKAPATTGYTPFRRTATYLGGERQ